MLISIDTLRVNLDDVWALLQIANQYGVLRLQQLCEGFLVLQVRREADLCPERLDFQYFFLFFRSRFSKMHNIRALLL